MRTKKIIIRTSSETVFIVSNLVEKSIYFSCTPIPDGEYELEVKEEAEVIVNKLLNRQA